MMKKLNKMLKPILSVMVFVAICASMAIYFPLNMSSTGDEDTEAVATQTPEPEPMPDYSLLEQQLNEMMADYSGDWSLYFEDYTTGEKIEINNHQVYSASLIKLYVIHAVYNEICSGALKDSEHIEELLTRMITWSDNDAWKELAQILGNGSYTNGMSVVTRVAQNEGFTNTGQFMQGSRRNFNFTCVEDCGTYLHRILDGTIINSEYSEKILDLLKRQEILHKIPSGVPEGIETANKTGELEYLEGDAAIVYAPSGTYILVVISQDMDDPGTAQSQIRNISSAVYNFRNPIVGRK
ncbi:MAG: serine hydrolase [Candidatus Ornithomonoglobus sp.]